MVVCPSNAEDGSAQMAALEQLSDAARRTGLTNLFLFVADPGQKVHSSLRWLHTPQSKFYMLKNTIPRDSSGSICVVSCDVS